jgi:hypothetical protein
MAEPRWWIRTQQPLDQPPNVWHLEMHEDEGAACGRQVAAPLERIPQPRRQERDPVCDECLAIVPFADGMSHAAGSAGERGELPEPP